MKREKKIGFHYSPYKTKEKKYDKDGDELYLLALNITYNRKSTKFPLSMGDVSSIFFTKEDIEEKRYYNEFVKKIEYELEAIVRFEREAIGEKYSIKGIKERMFYYRSKLIRVLDESMNRKLTQVLGDYFTYNEYIALKNPLSIVNEKSASSFIFLFEYHFFDKKKFLIKDKAPREFVDMITAYLAFSLYEIHIGNDIINSKSQGLILLDWIYSTFRNDFKKFIEAGISKELVQKVKVQDEIFFKVYSQYEKELINASFDDLWTALGKIAVYSMNFNKIKAQLDLMKLN